MNKYDQVILGHFARRAKPKRNPAKLGTLEAWSYGKNWWAKGTPFDHRKPKTFGPQLSQERAEELAEKYIRGELI